MVRGASSAVNGDEPVTPYQRTPDITYSIETFTNRFNRYSRQLDYGARLYLFYKRITKMMGFIRKWNEYVFRRNQLNCDLAFLLVSKKIRDGIIEPESVKWKLYTLKGHHTAQDIQKVVAKIYMLKNKTRSTVDIQCLLIFSEFLDAEYPNQNFLSVSLRLSRGGSIGGDYEQMKLDTNVNNPETSIVMDSVQEDEDDFMALKQKLMMKLDQKSKENRESSKSIRINDFNEDDAQVWSCSGMIFDKFYCTITLIRWCVLRYHSTIVTKSVLLPLLGTSTIMTLLLTMSYIFGINHSFTTYPEYYVLYPMAPIFSAILGMAWVLF